MLIIIVYWIQLLVSSAYIETGVYLKDIGKQVMQQVLQLDCF